MMTLMITFSAFAGQMSCPIAPPPPPTEATEVAGYMDTTVADIALNLMQGILALF